MFEGGSGPHAPLCQDAVRRQAILQHGDGEVAALAASDGRQQLLLRRHVLSPHVHSSRLSISNVRVASSSCAELVAAILKEGGLLEATSNPGSATPETLHRIYQSRAAATANPYVLRDLSATTTGLSFSSTLGNPVANGAEEREALLAQHSAAPIPASATSGRIVRWRDASPPRGHFRLISSVGAARVAYATQPSGGYASAFVGGGSSGHTGRAVRAAAAAAADAPVRRGSRTGLNLTLHSLDMRAPSRS